MREKNLTLVAPPEISVRLRFEVFGLKKKLQKIYTLTNLHTPLGPIQKE